MKNLNNYHKLSEILSFDTYLVSSVIHNFYDLDENDVIFKNLENLKLDNYAYALEEALKLDEDELKILALNYGFRSESSYIQYLTSLLSLNSIFFLDYRQKDQSKKESKYQTLSLFND